MEIELIDYKNCTSIKNSFCSMRDKKDCFASFLNNKAMVYSDSTKVFVNKNNNDIIGYFTYRYIKEIIVKKECPYMPKVEIMMFAIDTKYQDRYRSNQLKPIAAECLDISIGLLKKQGFGEKNNSICLYAAFHAINFYKLNHFVDITNYLIVNENTYLFAYDKQNNGIC